MTFILLYQNGAYSANVWYNIYMMGYGFDGGMMGAEMGWFGFITWLVIIVDLVLLGIWLWKKIK